MKNNLIKTSLAFSLFVSISAVTYGLGTWNTGYRAVDSGITPSYTNETGLFEKVTVDNDHGYDIFVPTKTFGEIKSLWDNPPTNVSFITEKNSFSALTLEPANVHYQTYGEWGCDGIEYPTSAYGFRSEYQTYDDYISMARYQIIDLSVPEDIEAYFNIRGYYNGDQPGENLFIFKQADGGSTVTTQRLHELYKDGTDGGSLSSSLNPPDFDFDNDGIDDIEMYSIDDPFDDGITSTATPFDVKTSTKVDFFAGSNFIRLQSGDSSTYGNFMCESGDYSNVTSIEYDREDSPEDLVWLSND